MSIYPKPVQLATFLVCFFLFQGCSADQPTDAGLEVVPTEKTQTLSIQVISGEGQSVLQRETLPELVVVRVTDEQGQPVSSVSIQANANSTSASVSPELAETDANGEAQFSWTVGYDFDNVLSFELSADPSRKASTYASATYRYFKPSLDADGWPVDELDLLDDDVQDLLDGIDQIRRGLFTEIHSLIIVQNGTLLLESYFPGKDSNGQVKQWSRTMSHEQQSASKSFRSALVGIALDKGFLSSLDQTIAPLFPELASYFTGTKKDISVRDMLTMSSGIQWNESGAAAGNSNNNLSHMYSLPRSSWNDYLFSQPMAFTPGSRFVYNTAASLLLDDIVVRASGQTLRDFVFNNYFNVIESGNVLGSLPETGWTKTPREMAKLGQIYLDKGMWKSTRVVSEQWVEDSFTEHMAPSAALGYGYQWWMQTLRTPNGTYRVRYASGNGGQIIMIVNELDLVVVSTGGNFGSSLMNQIFGLTETYVLPAFE